MSEGRERKRERKRERNAPGQTGPSVSDSGSSTHNDVKSSGGGGASFGGGSSSGSSGGAGGGRTGSGGWLRMAIMAAAIAAVGVGAYVGLSGGGDAITDQENQSRIAAHQTLLSSSGLPLTLVGADDVDAAIASLPDTVPQEAREEIRQQVNEGRLQLAWVTLWDTHVEDGDILRFQSSASIPVDVVALNAKTTLAIPFPPDGNVVVTGVKDGGGGITIALESGATTIAWPTMQPGDQLNLPVTPRF